MLKTELVLYELIEVHTLRAHRRQCFLTDQSLINLGLKYNPTFCQNDVIDNEVKYLRGHNWML